MTDVRFARAGLASERTQLAWQRFALALAVVGALALRAGLAGRHAGTGFAIAFVLGAAAFALQLQGPRIEPASAVRLAFGATLVAAAGSLALALA